MQRSSPRTESREPAADPAIAVARRHLALLEALGEIGIGLARNLGERAEIDLRAARLSAQSVRTLSAPAPAVEMAEAFTRLSRAIRLTLALEERTARSLGDMLAGRFVAPGSPAQAGAEPRAPAPAPAKAAEGPTASGKARADLADDERAEPRERLCEGESLSERLTESEDLEAMVARPLREVVGRICADLDVPFDWSEWAGPDEAASPQVPAPAGPAAQAFALRRPASPAIITGPLQAGPSPRQRALGGASALTFATPPPAKMIPRPTGPPVPSDRLSRLPTPA